MSNFLQPFNLTLQRPFSLLDCSTNLIMAQFVELSDLRCLLSGGLLLVDVGYDVGLWSPDLTGGLKVYLG